MTKLLFHGDSLADSRHLLNQAIGIDKQGGREIRYLDGSKSLPQELESTLGTANLFAPETLVIENLASRPLSKDKKTLLSLVKEYQGPKNLYLWEKKELTKTQINAFGKDLIARLSKAPAVIFKFLESFVPGNIKTSLTLLHETAAQAEDGFIFVMLSRHVSDLLIAKSGDTTLLNPWKKGRLVAQAQSWSEVGLLEIHHQLLTIDRAIKTGTTKLSYLDHLDLLLVSLLD